jgi:hypothetical protein
MILPISISKETTSAGLFGGARQTDESTPVARAAPDHAACRKLIERVVQQIESSEVRDVVGTVFQDLLRLLECLGLIESHLRQVDAADETFALFQLIHDDARTLVEFIREDGLNCPSMNEELADTLDGITFAVNHDLQRVFETERHGANSEPPAEFSDLKSQVPDSAVKVADSNPHVVVGKLYRAHDVLTNCLQQSTITLAMMFDPELEGTRLFNNSDMRYRQSLQLCQDLSALIQLAETAEKDSAALSNLTVRIERFRNESMECLAYSDWPQFESFCERIKVAASRPSDLEQVLHQFRCYLETLLGQVRMRAVLANVFPIQFGADNAEWSSATGSDNAPQSPAAFDLEEENAWDGLALAV